MNLYENIAKFYDLEDQEFQQDDLQFYLDYAKRSSNSILELGCGTGRVSLCLAKAGYDVTGIDLSAEMLNQFKTKLENDQMIKNRITMVYGDISNFDLKKQFNLIIAPGRVFQALTNDNSVYQSLQCIKNHLRKNGKLILDFFQPDSFLHEECCNKDFIVYDKVVDNENIVMKYNCESIDRKRKLVYSSYKIEVKTREYTHNFIEKNVLRYYSTDEVKKLLTVNGFVVKELYGWFDKTKIEGNREIICVVEHNKHEGTL